MTALAGALVIAAALHLICIVFHHGLNLPDMRR